MAAKQKKRQPKRAKRAPPKGGTNGTLKARAKFCEMIGQGVSITTAAKAAGASRTTVYRWRDEDKSFAEAWDSAREEGLDLLEDRALRLAHQGSERLIMFILKAGRPEKYKERVAADLTGHYSVSDEPMSEDEWEKAHAVGAPTRATEGAR
jgi:AcrR family transcriptional regulator